MGIGNSPRECSPLHHGEVPTHAGKCPISNTPFSFEIPEADQEWGGGGQGSTPPNFTSYNCIIY